MSSYEIVLDKVKAPNIPIPTEMPIVPKAVYQAHLDRFRMCIKKRSLDAVVIYADREHFSNFLYFTGFDPRFEEAILIIHSKDPSVLMLGNECFSLHSLSQIDVVPLICQQLSLPNQPHQESKAIPEILRSAGLTSDMKIGVVGWKLFPFKGEEYVQFSVPSFIIDALATIVHRETLIDATDLLISPEYGIRMINTADEIAFYEFGAAYASTCVENVLFSSPVGKSEIDLASECHLTGSLPLSAHAMLSAGKNAFKGLVSPTTNIIRHGDPLQQSVGLRGGLTVRNGYIDGADGEVSQTAADFVERVAIPYFTAAVAWMEHIGIGVTGGEMYELVDRIIPQDKFGWVLNPGHMIADEEWMCSPFYRGSNVTFQSGMLVQMDIIPNVPEYVSPNCEDGFCIADQSLCDELSQKYPAVWERMQQRRHYMFNEIGIRLRPEILPMSNISGYYRPYYLNRELAFRVKNQ